MDKDIDPPSLSPNSSKSKEINFGNPHKTLVGTFPETRLQTMTFIGGAPMKHSLIRAGFLFVTTAVMSVGIAFAAGALGPEREATMKSLNKEVKALSTSVKSGKFDAAKNKASADAIVAGLDHAKTLFPPGSEKAAKGTAPTIWTDRAGFDNLLTKAQEAGKGIAAATDIASLKVAVAAQGDTCKACHEKYRTANY